VGWLAYWRMGFKVSDGRWEGVGASQCQSNVASLVSDEFRK
jgi:hypothetical protein